MDNKSILDAIEPDAAAEMVSRRDAIAKGAKTTAFVRTALALGSVPVAIAALSREMYGQGTTNINSVLQFALLLENLEAEFYKTVTGGGTGFSATNNPQAGAFATVRGQLTAAETATLALIRDHEIAHVNFLRTTLGSAAPAPLTGTAFDFTGGGPNARGTGPFAAAGTNKNFLLAVTQAFEDTGVRAYKGQAGNLFSNPAVLQQALRIHSVEARHAAKIRMLRRQGGADAAVRISGTVRGTGAAAAGAAPATLFTGVPAASIAAATAAFEAIYANEQVTTQGTVNLTTTVTIPGVTGADLANAIGESFDEPLDRAAVTAIVQPFVIATIPAS